MKKVLSIILAAALLAACEQTPQNVKDKYGSSSEQDTVSVTSSADQSEATTDSSQHADDSSQSINTKVDKVDISELDKYSQSLNEYVKQKGYDKNFFLPENLKINSVSELYNFKLKVAENVDEKVPEIYNFCFGKDFEKDSGVNSVDKLKRASPDDKVTGFYYDETSLTQGAEFVDPNGYNEKYNVYNTSLCVAKTGFIYYKNQYNYFDDYTCCKQVFYSRGDSDNETLLMSDDSSYSCDEAVQYVQEYINKLFGFVNGDFEYKVGLVEICKNEQGKHVFDVTLQKTYKNIPMTDLFIGKYPTSMHTKGMFYTCTVSGKDKIVTVNAPFGFETLETAEKINDKVIPVTAAMDILSETLAPQIRLDISDIKLMYYNEYDASDFEEVKALVDSTGGTAQQLSEEQQRILMHPAEIPGKQFNCYPVWAFYIQKTVKENEYGISEAKRYDYILVNAQTGELINYIDAGSFY